MNEWTYHKDDLFSEDFRHDVSLKVHGDFRDTDEKHNYTSELCAKLNLIESTEKQLKKALQLAARLQAENTELKEQLEIEKYRIDILQEENMDLRDEKQNLDDQIADLVHERENG